MLYRIMKHYSNYGVKDFIIATGYKKNIIVNFFKKKKIPGWKVKVVDTGKNTMTGGRLKRLERYLKNETFMLTYGDGLSNVNLKKLLKFHKKHKKISTLTFPQDLRQDLAQLKLAEIKLHTLKRSPSLMKAGLMVVFLYLSQKFLNLLMATIHI